MNGFSQWTARRAGGFCPVKSVPFIPCQAVNSLLITFQRAAECTASRDPVSLRLLFTASPTFDTATKAAQSIVQNRNQLVGVYAIATPTEATIFDPMVMQTGSLKTNLPRRFLRENSGAITPNSILNPKGR